MACDPAQQNAILSFAAGNFAEGYCPPSYQQLATDIANALSGYLPGNFSSWNIGSTVPSVENQDKPWLELDASSCRPIRIWYWSGDSAWISLHPDFTGKVIMYEGLEADVPTLDGGEAGAVTAISGPMWEIVTEMAAKFPVGPGNLPGFQTPPVPTVIPIGGTGGQEGQSIVLTIPNLPAHTHDIGVEASSDLPDSTSEVGRLQVSDGSLHWRNNASVKIGRTRNVGEGTGIDVAKLPPYRSIWFLRKTARLYYRR